MRAKEFLNQHADFEHDHNNIFSDGKNEFHVSILVEYVEAMIEAGHLRDTGTYELKTE